MRCAVALLALLLAGCASDRPTTFLAHYTMPAACRDEEAMRAIKVSVVDVDRLPYALGIDHDAYGLWVERPEGNTIMILRGLSPQMRTEAIKHERCHELIFRLTGDPRWHGGE